MWGKQLRWKWACFYTFLVFDCDRCQKTSVLPVSLTCWGFFIMWQLEGDEALMMWVLELECFCLHRWKSESSPDSIWHLVRAWNLCWLSLRHKRTEFWAGTCGTIQNTVPATYTVHIHKYQNLGIHWTCLPVELKYSSYAAMLVILSLSWQMSCIYLQFNFYTMFFCFCLLWMSLNKKFDWLNISCSIHFFICRCFHINTSHSFIHLFSHSLIYSFILTSIIRCFPSFCFFHLWLCFVFLL